MLGKEFGHLGLDRLRQQGARSVAQHLGERVGERPWLKQLDEVTIGHGGSLLCWRCGGSDTPTIPRLLPLRPSPTSPLSSVWARGAGVGSDGADQNKIERLMMIADDLDHPTAAAPAQF